MFYEDNREDGYLYLFNKKNKPPPPAAEIKISKILRLSAAAGGE
jgi:hypothetical protein